MATDQIVGLPAAEDFGDIEVPEFPRKYTKRQGPASMKKSTAGRTFSASGPKADLIARMIFADMQLTRTQMATIAKCSPSRVSEVIWALEDAVRKGTIESFPPVPQKPPVAEDEVTDEETTDEDVERQPSELAEDIQAALSGEG
jgi:hypothetical protein